MIRIVPILPIFVAAGLSAFAAEGDVVFKSDVSLVRVDAQVLDRNNRAITGLRADDFVLREEGKPQEIRNFASENMPVDVLLLLDVSASMRPHVERIANAAHEALRVLTDKDRVGIMVFDRSSRVRLPFRGSRSDVEREFETLLRQETFHGGTDITRGLLDAARYVEREGRREARRAIVIVTDDQTEYERNEDRVSRALQNANAVLSLLLAPDAMQNRTWPGGGGGRGGIGGGGMGGGLGGIILGGGGGPYGGRRGGQGPVMRGPRTKSAGTAEIARGSGGDSMSVDDASAFETTLERIRQRYALHFYQPPGVKPGQQRNIEVALSDAARRRYPDADVRFRRVYLAPGGAADAPEPTEITRRSTGMTGGDADSDRDRPILRRKPASAQEPQADVSQAGAPQAGTPQVDTSRGGWRKVDGPLGGASGPIVRETDTTTVPDAAAAQPAEQSQSQNRDSRPAGWRKLKPGEQP